MQRRHWRNNTATEKAKPQQFSRKMFPRLLQSYQAMLIISTVTSGNVAASVCSEDSANPIVRENYREGSDPTIWDVNGAGDESIQGFATDISTTPGGLVKFKIDTKSNLWRIDIFRLGYYGGLGARKIATIRPRVALPQEQPDCIYSNDTLLVDCGNWHVSAEWSVPTESVSGIYFGRAVREDAGLPNERKNWRTDASSKMGDAAHAMPDVDPYIQPPNLPHAYGRNGYGKLKNALVEPRASHIWFVVRGGVSDLVVQTGDATWQAYNGYGGFTTYGTFNSPYSHGPNPRYLAENELMLRAHKASYNRPTITRGYRPVNMPLTAEYPLVRFLEANGYDVTYTTCVDAARYGEDLLRHRVYVSVGHDEYWSGQQRRAVTKARDAGVHLMFLSGNEAYWKVRWEPSVVDGTDYRTMVIYKDSQSNVKLDPSDEWTGTWRDARAINPEGPQPENVLTGTLFTANAQRVDALQIPPEFQKLRFWRNTDISGLPENTTYTTFKGVLGHEWDSDIDNGFRPAGMIRLSRTEVNNVQFIHDHGSVFDTGTGVHHLVLYKAASGALVFGAGTVQWTWALDAHHDPNDPPRANMYDTRVETDTAAPDVNLQQAFVNILADMDTQPSNLRNEWGLHPAYVTTDREAPTSTVVQIADDLDTRGVHSISVVTKATDLNGVVAAVEVSFDGGTHFHPSTRALDADGDTWVCEWGANPSDFLYDDPRAYKKLHGGTLDIHVRAIDDSLNMEIAHGRMSPKDEL